MSFLDDIRKQPRHHREIMFGLCVVTTISLVGMVWYNSFEKNLYALLNPGQNTDQRFLAENKTAPSLLGNIGQTGKDLKAAFYNIFSSIGGSVFGGNLTGNGEKDPAQNNSAADILGGGYSTPPPSDRQQKGQKTLDRAGIIIENSKATDSGKVYTLPISGKK